MESVVQRSLVDAGYAFVQVQPRLAELRNHRPDVLGWAANADGDLVPWVVVEVKRGFSKPPELALPQMARYRDLLGTVDHYIVIDDEWFRADEGMRSIERVDAPNPPRFGSAGELSDVKLVTSLLVAALWRETDSRRGEEGSVLHTVAELIRSATELGVEIAPGEFAHVSPHTMFQASRSLVATATERDRRSSIYALNPVLVRAMAALAGRKLTGTVVDPFAGVGSLLWAVADEAAARGAQIRLHGRERTESILDVAEAVALSSPVPVTFEMGGDLFEPPTSADVIVCLPPFGIRPQSNEGPPALLNGERAKDGDIAIVDAILRSLNPGGRAVLLVPSSFTFRTAGEGYRHFLAENFRVAALIGIEAALQPHTSISTVLMVIDDASPGETFVAQLAGDWETQLAPGGAALEAAMAHIEASSVGP